MFVRLRSEQACLWTCMRTVISAALTEGGLGRTQQDSQNQCVQLPLTKNSAASCCVLQLLPSTINLVVRVQVRLMPPPGLVLMV